jgi:Ni,Fe-hydrogenase III large subunit
MSETYRHVCGMERPLAGIRHLGSAVMLLTESMEEPHSMAVNEIVHIIREHIEELDRIYALLFRLHHPDRERFERDD